MQSRCREDAGDISRIHLRILVKIQRILFAMKIQREYRQQYSASEYNIEYAIIHLRLTEFGIRYKIRVFCKRYKNTSKYVKIHCILMYSKDRIQSQKREKTALIPTWEGCEGS